MTGGTLTNDYFGHNSYQLRNVLAPSPGEWRAIRCRFSLVVDAVTACPTEPSTFFVRNTCAFVVIFPECLVRAVPAPKGNGPAIVAPVGIHEVSTLDHVHPSVELVTRVVLYRSSGPEGVGSLLTVVVPSRREVAHETEIQESQRVRELETETEKAIRQT